MYGFIWRKLPGPKWLKAIEALILFFLVVAFLFKIGFPWLDENTGINDITIE
ncbi:hypothetical protein [Arcanobacterium sp. S3PF19]|uniref:hypothetical protein n=1 Tax=Arcanobacterium sp. S3PF19 TaxID=1219585 RepID=UPI00050E1F32|nr:hypothetical protein [Arcanobacterium sp. S3PF19]KGF05717.1 membrane protein [Arcanobacterium sp. S3PF19]